VLQRDSEGIGDGAHVFVTSTAEVHENDVVLSELWGELAELGDRVGGLEGGDDAFCFTEELEASESFGVGDGVELGTLGDLEPGELGANARVVETGGDGVSFRDLTPFILEKKGPESVEDAGAALAKGGGVTGLKPLAGGFDADETDGVIEQRVEEAHGVGSTSDTGEANRGQPAFLLENLLASFATDD